MTTGSEQATTREALLFAALTSLVGDHDIHPAFMPDCPICVALWPDPRVALAASPPTAQRTSDGFDPAVWAEEWQDLRRQLHDMTEARDVLAARLAEKENQP